MLHEQVGKISREHGCLNVPSLKIGKRPETDCFGSMEFVSDPCLYMTRTDMFTAGCGKTFLW